MWSYIAGKVLRNRSISVIVVIIVTIFMAYKAKDIELAYQYLSLLPQKDPAYKDMKFFNERFGDDGNVLIIGVEDKDFFKKDKFNGWIKLQNDIKKVKGVTGVLSVSNVFRLEKDSKNHKFISRRLYPDYIETQEEIDSLTRELKEMPIYDNLVYFDSTNVYFMAVTLDSKFVNSKRREVLIQDIQNFANKWGKDYGEKIRFSGLPFTRTKISLMIKNELYLFVALAMFVTALILFMFFRSFKVVLFSSLIVGIGVIWTFGSLGIFGYDITILTGMIPPLLIVIGIPNSVFLLNKFHSEFRNHGNKMKALHRVIAKVGNATFLTNATTAVGFATFVSTGNQALVEFGLIASINIIGVFILSITLIPVFFSFLANPKDRHIKHLDYKYVGKIVESFVYIVENKRKVIYISVVVLIGVAIFGVTKIKTLGYIIDDIPKDDPIYLDLKFFEKAADGVLPLEIVIAKKNPKDSLSYTSFVNLNKFEESLIKYDEISKPLSLATAFKFINQEYYKGKIQFYKFPDAVQANRLVPYLNGLNNEKNLLASFIDSSYNATRISLRVKDIGTIEMKKLHDKLFESLRTYFPEKDYYISVTGSSIVFAQGTGMLVNNLFQSLALAIIIIGLLMATMFSSFRMVVISIIPNIIPLLFTAAIMGYFGITIKPSTILVFSIAFGISVDNAIHFLTKYRQELLQSNWDIYNSVINAVRETGVSVIYTVTILFFGFGMFTLSDFGGTVALGLLISITLLFGMITNLILLPSILLSLKDYITTKAFKEHLINSEEEMGSLILEEETDSEFIELEPNTKYKD